MVMMIFLIGAPANDRAYLILGHPTPTGINLANADVVFTGEIGSNSTGFSVAGAGDVNGDGQDDLLIGAPGYNFDEGRAYVAFGNNGPFPTNINLGSADRLYFGTFGQNLGWSVAGAGDVNGDGFADMLISFVNSTGGAYLVLGASNPKQNCTLDTCTDEGYRGTPNSSTGGIVGSAGDVNGDGYADLLIGACDYPNQNSRGRVSLVLGRANPHGVKDLDIDADAHFEGMTDGDLACVVGSGAGDVNGDGFSDLFIGAPNRANKQGYAYLLFSDDTASEATRYRRINASDYVGGEIGLSGVSVPYATDMMSGSLYVTRHYRHTCASEFVTNGLLWEVNSQHGSSAEFHLSFKYNDTQIAGWDETELKLWYRDRTCQDWVEDNNATLDEATNRITTVHVH